MRFGLIDLLFVFACWAIGGPVGFWIASDWFTGAGPVAAGLGGLLVYLGFVDLFYRRLQLFPMVLPRCPSCRQRAEHYSIRDRMWPRIRLQCPACQREFTVDFEARSNPPPDLPDPVLILRWPYPLGRYQPVASPKH